VCVLRVLLRGLLFPPWLPEGLCAWGLFVCSVSATHHTRQTPTGRGGGKHAAGGSRTGGRAGRVPTVT
jgi:hypothetical protein